MNKQGLLVLAAAGLLLALVLTTLAVHAQGDASYTFLKWTTGPGGTSRQGNLELGGVVAQGPSGISSGGNYVVNSSYWSVASSSAPITTTTPTFTPTGPTPTGSPVTSTPSDTSIPDGSVTPTATNTPPACQPGEECPVYLPVAVRNEVTDTPTPTPTATSVPAWRLLGGANIVAGSLAIYGNNIFVGDRGTGGSVTGGLHSGSVIGCPSTVSLNRINTVQTGVFGIAFRADGWGALASYAEGMYYTPDGGSAWALSSSPVIQPGSVTVVNGIFFAGSQNAGVYQSNTAGIDWFNLDGVNLPPDINVLIADTMDPDLLWIGTESGVYNFTVGVNRDPSHPTGGLSGESEKVWDIVFDTRSNIYLATKDGVYKGNGNSDWERFGTLPLGKPFLSLAIIGDVIYAGAEDPGNSGTVAGVWRRPLLSSDWEEVVSAGWDRTSTVRDLLYDGTHCDGLLAATDNGVWLYPIP